VIAAGAHQVLWERAFQLGYFVLRDRTAARECLARALEKLAAQQSREKRRIYWRSRKKRLTIRRISRPPEDTLQWLICLESEACEKEQEARGEQTEADMVVRYVKHLAQTTTVNSSFHVNVGFNRLLRSYTTPEVQQIYELATERYPGAEEYRKAKGKLLNQLIARFGGLLRTRSAQYGEVLFETYSEREPWSALVEECLERFAPWSARQSCFGAGHAQPVAVDAARGHTGHPSRPADRLEASRCHWFMHSTCCGRLVEQLGLDPPGERLSVPRFLHHHDGDSGSTGASSDRHTPPLSDGDTRMLRERVAAVAAQHPFPGPLKIIAHGTVCARLVSGGQERRSFQIPEGTQLLEVWSDTPGESRILATHWIDYDDAGLFRASEYAIALHGGRRLTLDIAPLPDTDEALHHATVTVELRAPSPFQQRVRSVWAAGPDAHPLRLVLASVACMTLGVLASGLYFQSRLARDQTALGRLSDQVSAQQATIVSLKQTAPEHSASPPTRYAFSANTPNLREAGQAGEPVIIFAPGEPLAVLELPAQSGEHASYRATLSSFPDEEARLTEAALRPVKRGESWVVEFALPASLVENDTHYLLNLTPTAGSEGTRYLFEVRKR
jgi:hypothetical protein